MGSAPPGPRPGSAVLQSTAQSRLAGAWESLREEGDRAGSWLTRRIEPGYAQGASLDIIALEDISARAWPALHTGRIGGWRLNASTGHTGRANTCWALEAPDRPVGEAFEAVEAWYAGLGLPPKFKTVEIGRAH